MNWKKSMPNNIEVGYYQSPIGWLSCEISSRGISSIKKLVETPQANESESLDPVLKAFARQLDLYFAGHLRTFDLPLDIRNGSEFFQQVWSELLNIPFGETRSYGQIALRVGGMNKSRAVGLANASNPIPIIIPCHRVIGQNGTLTGYGLGLPAKEYLLALENPKRWAQQPQLFNRL
jgi:methylated-DNA-[protein]-cysteine S-methyltransferase